MASPPGQSTTALPSGRTLALASAGALVVAAVIWVLAKALKWSLYALIGVVLVGGLGASIWLLFH